jgi:hypothetical protein
MARAVLRRAKIKLLFLSVLLALTISIAPTYAQEDGSQFTNFAGFDLGTVTLSEIEQKYGPTTLIESGDAGEYEAKICYRLDDGILYFLSGEMGGSNHKLLGFAVCVSRTSESEKCAGFPIEKKPLKLNLAGLHLGMSKAEFENVFSTKVKWNGTTGTALFESKRAMTQKERERLPKEVQEGTKAGIFQNYFDVGVSIIGYFEGNNLVEFRVWKVETL